jgi:hypothetical protein
VPLNNPIDQTLCGVTLRGVAYVRMLRLVEPSRFNVAREYVGLLSNGGVVVCSNEITFPINPEMMMMMIIIK